MPAKPDFFWDFLPFWIVAYSLAVVGWTCVGRFLMSAFLPPDSPNYIYRWFVRLTAWPVQFVAFFTPAFVLPRILPLVTAFWAFLLRYVAYVIFARYGMAPTLGVN